MSVDCTIIIPLYNEEGNVAPLTEALEAALKEWQLSYEVLMVNDGSKDSTEAELDRVCGDKPNYHAIHLKRNYGQTAAIMAGLDHADGDIIVMMDGDLQNDPTDIPMVVAELDKGYDLCSGWRRDRHDTQLTRVLPSKLANMMISVISGVKLNDYGCTLKAYRRSVIEDVRLYGEMHRFIPIYATWQGARVCEVVVKHHARERGTSNYGLNRIFKVILDLIVVKFLADYSQKPIYVFGGVGLASFAGSLFCFLLMIYYKFWGGKTFVETPLPQLVILLFMMGFMSILMGLLAEMIMRTYYESQDRKVYQIRKSTKQGH